MWFFFFFPTQVIPSVQTLREKDLQTTSGSSAIEATCPTGPCLFLSAIYIAFFSKQSSQGMDFLLPDVVRK